MGKVGTYVVSREEEMELERNVLLKGVSDKIYDEYRKYAMEVLTLKEEGFSMVLLEGKANWLPEVAFDIYSGPSDLIMDGVSGYLVKPFDVEALAEKICYLTEHPEVRFSFSRHDRDNIDHFRCERVIAQRKDLLDSLIAKKERS